MMPHADGDDGLQVSAARIPSPTSSLICAALAGGLLAVAYPPFPLGFLASLAIAWFLVIVHGLAPRQAAKHGYIFGFVFHFATLYWTGWVSGPGMVVMVAILGLYVSIVFWLWAWIRSVLGGRAVWLFPFIWVAHEHLRGVGDLAFPWTNLSLSQVHYLPLIQFADITGDLGVGLWICFLGVFIHQIFRAWTQKKRFALGVLWAGLVLMFAVPYAYGQLVLGKLSGGPAVRLAVLQGDIDSYRKWDSAYVDQSFAIYEAQSRAAAARGARLIIWPETAAPVYIRSEPRYRRELRELSSELGVPLLVGTLEYENVKGGGYLSYNAAVVFDSGAYHPEYHAKLHLVPLGEWIPFSDRIKVLDHLEVGGAHFTRGTKYVLFPHQSGAYAAAICYESVFPEIIRGFAIAGARFFVNITNDGWYGFSSGPVQHALIAVYRAIETRRPIARSANTGISTLIDCAGRLHNPTAQYVPDVLLADLPLGYPDGETFFVMHGMFVGKWSLILTIVSAAWVSIARLRKRRAKGNAESTERS